MSYTKAFILCFIVISKSYAQTPVSPTTGTGAQGSVGSYYNEQVWHIPLKGEPGRRIAAIVYKGIGTRPLAVITHGTEKDSNANKDWRIGLYPHAIEYFINAGYHIAIVHRRGYGLTGGSPSEGFKCILPNHFLAGNNAANDIISVVDYMGRQPFVKDKNAIVIGQSTGGWSAIAVAASNYEGIKGVINFAGGRNGTSAIDKTTCGLDDLVRDATLYGKKAKTPSLWIYTKNDKLFDENLSSRMAAAYKQGGAPLEFHLLENFGRNGHGLFPNKNGLKEWAPIVKNFLARL